MAEKCDCTTAQGGYSCITLLVTITEKM